MTRSNKCRLRPRKSKFVDIFRTTPPKTVCPNFYVLAHADGCSFQPQCSYCYLKSSFWYLRDADVFSNLDRLEREVREWIATDGLETYMLNSGNLSDSLAFEKVRPLMGRLIEVFREHAKGRRHTLLIVTKGGRLECAALLDTPPCANVVVSFSVNSEEAARLLEAGAATIAERFAAAAELKARGWQVRELGPERVTLGSLRAEHSLLHVIGNGLFRDLEKPADPKGLSRYPLARRLELYRPAVAALRDLCPVGLCEEMAEVWDALALRKDDKPCNCCV
jgi:hypothetical protein